MKRTRRTSKRRLKSISALILLLCIAGLAYYFAPKTLIRQFVSTDSAPDETALSVTFLDVGQGNCVLAESDGHYMLIDGGDNKHSSFVVSYLKEHGIDKLDYVIVSHYDSDHLSGVIGAMYNTAVGTLLAPGYEGDTKTYQSYINCLEAQNITATTPDTGDTFTLGKASFTVVCPQNYDYTEENNLSLGIRLTDSYHSFLIVGDAQSKSENDMIKSGINIESDVYLVSHHGSRSSSSAKFLDAVNPSYAVISVGADNDYGHPADEVLSRLDERHIQILRTDENGTITAYSTPSELQWQLEK
jgi:beta-lactamase superfamily II metal-dependent hydrolase